MLKKAPSQFLEEKALKQQWGSIDDYNSGCIYNKYHYKHPYIEATETSKVWMWQQSIETWYMLFAVLNHAYMRK